MYYIKNGLGKKWKWLGYLFATFGVFAVFGTGNATQVNTITTSIDTALTSYNVMGEKGIGTLNFILGIILAILIAFILIGGVQRIGAVTEKLVPFMAVFYILLGLGVLELSMSPNALAEVRGVIRKTSMRDSEHLAKVALTAADPEEVMVLAKEHIQTVAPDIASILG